MEVSVTTRASDAGTVSTARVAIVAGMAVIGRNGATVAGRHAGKRRTSATVGRGNGDDGRDTVAKSDV